MNEDKIKVIVNKKEEHLDKNITVAELLRIRGLKKAAVWINGRQLLKAEYDKHILCEGDNIKLLRIMAGG